MTSSRFLQSSDDGAVMAFLYITIVIFVLFLRCAAASERRSHMYSRVRQQQQQRQIQMRQRQATQQQRGQQSQGNNGEQIILRVNRETGQAQILRVVPVASLPGHAVAKEQLQDGNTDFIPFDPTERIEDVDATRLKTQCISMDWACIKAFLAQMRAEGETPNRSKQAYYTALIVKHLEKTWPTDLDYDTTMSRMLDQWVQAEPNDAECRILRASAMVAWAWHARSSTLARFVTPKQWDLFKKRLTLAAEEIRIAKELRPTDPRIYSIAMTVARGCLGLPETELQDRMTMAQCEAGLKDVSNEPHYYNAHLQALQFYCRKWGGSHERMFSYARSITSQLPEGHPLWVLIPMAHYERVLIEKVQGYWRNPSVVQELRSAYQKAFPGQTGAKVQATEPYELSQEWTCRNYFAYTLAASGQNDIAKAQIRVIGKRPTICHPWISVDRYKSIINALGFETAIAQQNPAPVVEAQDVTMDPPPGAPTGESDVVATPSSTTSDNNGHVAAEPVVVVTNGADPADQEDDYVPMVSAEIV